MPHAWWCRLIGPRHGANYRPGQSTFRRRGNGLGLDELEPRQTPVVSLSVGDASFNLATGSTGITVTRSGDTAPQVAVNYSVSDVTAVAGTNYQASPATGKLTFAPGVTTQTIPLAILPNNFAEASRTFSVDLTSVAGVLGTPATLSSQQTFATGSKPVSVVVADVNGDGKPDLIVANYDSGTVSVLLNTTAAGATTPSFAPQQTFAVGSGPHSVVVADVNGDGKPDLIVANYASDTVSVLLNTTTTGATTPSFAAQQTFAVGSLPEAVTVADVNGDGKPDLAVVNFASNNVSVLLNTTTAGATTASFAPQQTFAVGSLPEAVAVADVNGDGKPDLAVANYTSGTVSVLLNTTTTGAATASFATQQTFSVGSGPRSVAAADVNGDGQPDLVVANYGSNTASVLLNSTITGATTASFATQQTFATGTKPDSVAVADVNQDGQPDLVVANHDSNTVSVLQSTTTAGATTASFDTQQTFTTGSGPFSVVAADVNGDGQPDLVIANHDSNTVSVLVGEQVTLGAAGTVTIDSAPVVTSIAPAGANPTAATNVAFSVTFSEPISGLTASNFSLSGTATSGASVGTPTTTDGGQIWSVPVTTGPEGTLELDLSNPAGISDAVGNKLYDSTSDNGSAFTAVKGSAYTIDRTGPTVTIGPPSAPVVDGGPLTFAITYADPDFATSTLTAANVTLNATGTATGTVSVTGSGTAWSVTISGIIGDGTLGISLAAGTATDTAGNAALAAGPSGTAVVDNTPPTVSGITTLDPGESPGTDSFTVTFDEPVTGLTAADFSLAGSLASTSSVAAVNPTGTAASVSWVIGLAVGPGGGTIALVMSSGVGVGDDAGNAPVGLPVTGPTLTYPTSVSPPPPGSPPVSPPGSPPPVSPPPVSPPGSPPVSPPPVSPPGSPPVSPPPVSPPGSPPASPPASPPGSPPVSPPGSPPASPPPSSTPSVSLVGANQVAVGPGNGGGGQVIVYNANGTQAYTVFPFGDSFTAGVRVAVADFNGDGVPDLVAATGPGVTNQVVVLDGNTHQVLASFSPFESTFTGGLFVTVGDVNKDGVPDLVITPDQSGGPVVAIYDGASLGQKQVVQLARFFGIADPNFRGGARAAVGDINGDGVGDVIVSAGFGGGPRIAIYDGTTLDQATPKELVPDFFAFDSSLRNGAFVTAGDFTGKGYADLVFGAGPGGGPRVRVIDSAQLLAAGNFGTLDSPTVSDAGIADFFAGDTSNRGGVPVAIANLDGDARADLVTGAGAGAGSTVTSYSGISLAGGGTPATLFAVDAIPGFNGGVFVG
ncbi:beta strand repeat-containing protein [Fimbriiglobus ruber]|uniref:Alkaline phosphatase n=1 Tax=Fimbriiglobus ruber TaxID=1908690 RepID=A0A225DFR8_9BACT|nr:FG-GAP-like repeat-containing protein [Fimbriiglobus ruber]OWK35245.1 Alkaline phosphatase [Fimbriiglobus ruber]